MYLYQSDLMEILLPGNYSWKKVATGLSMHRAMKANQVVSCKILAKYVHRLLFLLYTLCIGAVRLSVLSRYEKACS